MGDPGSIHYNRDLIVILIYLTRNQSSFCPEEGNQHYLFLMWFWMCPRTPGDLVFACFWELRWLTAFDDIMYDRALEIIKC